MTWYRVEEFLSIAVYIITDYHLRLIISSRIKNSTLLVINKTKMLFSQKRIIHVTYRSGKKPFKIVGHFLLLPTAKPRGESNVLTGVCQQSASQLLVHCSSLLQQLAHILLECYLFEVDMDIHMTFRWPCSFCRLYLDPMTLGLKLGLDMVKIYVCTENEIPSFNGFHS